MRTMRSAVVLLVLLAAVGFLTTQAAQAQAASAGTAAFNVPADVRAIFNNHCVKCHGGSTPTAGISYETNADLKKLLNMPATEKTSVMMIAPGDPANSYIIMKVKGATGIVGSRMPLAGKPLTTKQIGILEAWIQGMDPKAAASTPAATTPAAATPAAATPAATTPAATTPAGTSQTTGGATTPPAGTTSTSSGGTTPAPAAKAPAPPDPKMIADEMFDGAHTFQRRCIGCHGKSGEGVTLFGPPLAGSAFIMTGTSETIGEVIQNGRKYNDMHYPEYSGMPAWQFIRGGELQALIDFLKGPLQGK